MALGLWALRRDEPPHDDADLRSYRRSVKDEENGFRLVNVSVDDVVWPDDEEEELVEGHSEVFDEEKAAELADRNAAVLERVDRCLALPEFQLDLLESMDAEVPYLLGWRKLAYALASRSRLRLERDDPAGAYEDGMRLVRLGRRIQKAQGTLIEYLVGVAVQAIGIQKVLEPAIQGRLPVQVLEQGIDTFTRELPMPLEFQDMLRAEYIVMAATFDLAAKGEIFESEYSIRWARFFFKPNETKRFLGEEIRILIDSISMPALERPRRDVSTYEATFPEMFLCAGFGKIMLHHMLPVYEDAPAQADLCRFGLSAAHALFAVLAHQADKGALPESLDALVPGHLASLPLDPFDGKALRYSAAKQVIYSIGADGVDSGGSSEEKASDALGDSEEPTLRFDPAAWKLGDDGGDAEPSEIEDEE